jgi:hypothetical protein
LATTRSAPALAGFGAGSAHAPRPIDQGTCDEPIVTTTARIHLTFASFTVTSESRSVVTATVSAGVLPSEPYRPADPYWTTFSGILYLPGVTSYAAVGTFVPPDPIGSGWRFDAELVPGGARTITWAPTDHYRFVGFSVPSF